MRHEYKEDNAKMIKNNTTKYLYAESRKKRFSTGWWLLRPGERGGGYSQKNLVGGVRPASQNPHPIYDQNLRRFSPILFMTRPKIR